MEKQEHIPTRDDYYSSYFKHEHDVRIDIRFATVDTTVLPKANQFSLNKNAPLGENAARELFLWAIFLDRFDLAKYLCSKTWVTLRSRASFVVLNQNVCTRINRSLH